MNYEISNLTDNEHNLITEMLNSISQIENILSTMTTPERIAWFRSKQFPRKIDFEKRNQWNSLHRAFAFQFGCI